MTVHALLKGLLMRIRRSARLPGGRVPRILLFAGLLAAAVLAFGAGVAPAPPLPAVTCTGVQATDEPAVNAAINTYSIVTINGPKNCVGNFLADSVDVTIQGGVQPATLYGFANTSAVLTVDGVIVNLNHMKITHGDNASADGGGIFAHGAATLMLNNSTVTGNITENGGDGGGIELRHATLWATSSWITGNTASGGGGGLLAVSGSPVHLTNSTVSNNTANSATGGGIDLDKTGANPGTLIGTTVSSNTALDAGGGSFGGGIDVKANSLTVTNSNITLNTAGGTGYGGGIFASKADVSLIGTSVQQNTALYGGGIWNEGTALVGGLYLTDSNVAFNIARSDGGGIANDSFQSSASTTIEDSSVANNRALSGNGGGIANMSESGATASVVITGSTLDGNRAMSGNGGAIDNRVIDPGGMALVSLAQTSVGPRPYFLNDGNKATNGGGIANDGSNGTASVSLQPGATVIRNIASVDGGGIYNTGGGLLLIVPGALVLFNAPDNIS
jgi:fibronectin-binding autotransporter adhesin